MNRLFNFLFLKHLNLLLNRLSWWTFRRDFAIFQRWIVETLAANRFVWLCPSYKLNFLWLYCSLSKSSRLSAIDTDCGQFIDFLRQWDKIDNIAEWFSLEGAIQGSNDHNDASVGQLLSNFDNVFKKLSFIDSNYIVFDSLVFYIFKFSCFERFMSDSKVMIKFYWSWVAITSSEEYLLSWR